MKRHTKVILSILSVVVILSTTVISVFAESGYGLSENATHEIIDCESKVEECLVGDFLYFNLFDDITEQDHRVYYMDICKLIDGRFGEDFQQQVEYVGAYQWHDEYYDEDKYSLMYQRQYYDEGNNIVSGMYYDPLTQFRYDKIYVLVSFWRDGLLCSAADVAPTTKTLENAHTGEATVVQGFSLNTAGTYRITIDIQFYDTDTEAVKWGIFEHTISCKTTLDFYSQAYENGYNNGYYDGYELGYSNGIASDEEFTLFGGLNALVTAPIDFLSEALNFEVFGVNLYNFVRVVFSLLLIVFVVVVVLRLVV